MRALKFGATPFLLLLLAMTASTSLVRLKSKLTQVRPEDRKIQTQSITAQASSDNSTLSVPQTSVEAQAAKKSAVQRGYWADDFIQYFVEGDFQESFFPDLRRDYWIRIYSIRSIQKQFLAKVGDGSDLPKRQIINFGCGLDTAAFNFIKDKSKFADFAYFELDLEEVAELKAELISKSPAIQQLISNRVVSPGAASLVDSDAYKLATCDLTDLDSLDETLRGLGVDFSKPTLVITEFVLPYIGSQHVNALVHYLGRKFKNIAMVDNSVTHYDDEFGKDFRKLFQDNHIPIKAAEFFMTPQVIKENYQQNGFSLDLREFAEVYQKCIDQRERKRIETLEVFEDRTDVMKHYFISLAKKCTDSSRQTLASAECRIISRLDLGHLKL